MAPGVPGLPAAAGPDPARAPGDAVDVAPAVDRYLGSLPRRSVLVMRLGLRAFEWLPFPWRFSRADLAARQDFLARLDASGGGWRGEILMFLKILAGLGYGNDERVRRAVGYEMTCGLSEEAVASAPAPPGPGALGDLRPSGPEEECDVAIVGSGAGGAVAATLLAEAGLEVAVLEAGGHMDRHTYPDEPLAALEALYRDGGLTVAEGRPAIPTPVGRAVGGTTVINSGTCFRAPDELLAGWRDRHGIEWAMELDPDYAQGEEMLHVQPVDPERMGRNGQLLMEGADALGVSHHPLARNAGDCVQCSSCPQGCRLDAKRAMHVSYLPRAVAAGARIRAGVDARRIIFDGTRAAGLECLASSPAGDGVAAARPFTLRARKAVLLAGGSFGTPELLLRSRFRSEGGQLGRNLRLHPSAWVGARFEEEVRGWDGIMQSYAVDEWKDRGVLMEATFTPLAFGAQWLPGVGAEHQQRVADYRHVASTGVQVSDTSHGRVGLAGDGSLRISYSLNRHDADSMIFGIARLAELLYAAGATEVYPQIAGIPAIPRERIADLEASPPRRSALRLEAFHPMGTARMDAEPGRGVAGTDGAVHGADSLYIADASLFPSSVGVNPMMTVIAMASRISRQLADTVA